MPLTRRTFLATSLTALAAASPWRNLFDGRSLDGWTPVENKDSWKVVDGALSFDGKRSHLFYTGPGAADFKNCELEVEARTAPASNSGVYFHTAMQDRDFPNKGFEVQINHTAGGEGTYRERKKTGSLYGLRNVYKQIAADGEWFKLHTVRGKNIQVRVNGMLVVDYIEPTPAYVPAGHEPGRYLDRGTFALQGHDAGSKVQFRLVRVRTLPNAAPALAGPVVDDTFRAIIEHGRNNIALVDFDVAWKTGMSIEKILRQSRRDGFQRGVAAAVHDDRSAARFADALKGQVVFAGLRTSNGDWTRILSHQAASRFDYVLRDASTWKTAEEAVAALDREPIDICANLVAPSEAVLTAMAKNGVALQMNERSKSPSAEIIKTARKMGVKLTFGSGAETSRCEYGVAVARDLKLHWQDFWVAGAWGGSKAVDRKKEAFHA